MTNAETVAEKNDASIERWILPIGIAFSALIVAAFVEVVNPKGPMESPLQTGHMIGPLANGQSGRLVNIVAPDNSWTAEATGIPSISKHGFVVFMTDDGRAIHCQGDNPYRADAFKLSADAMTQGAQQFGFTKQIGFEGTLAGPFENPQVRLANGRTFECRSRNRQNAGAVIVKEASRLER